MPRSAVLWLIGLLTCAYVAVVVAQDNASQNQTAQDKSAQDKAAAAGDNSVETAAQPGDGQAGKVAKDIADLKQTVAEQDKKIAELEKAVKLLQATLIPVPKPIPSNTPPWRSPSSWNLVKAGMSEAQVVEILGLPTNVQSVTDSRTLFYQPDAHSTSNLNGSVTLMDDRVVAMSPPAF